MPGLRDVFTEAWDPARFAEWIDGHGASVNTTTSPVGLRLTGEAPKSVERVVHNLVRALADAQGVVAAEYPLPHYRRSA